MAEKITFTIDEIAAQAGVSKGTVRNRMQSVKDLLEKNKRKRFYNPNEVQLILSLFHPQIQGL